jgi:pantoate--beta-alanine ligase
MMPTPTDPARMRDLVRAWRAAGERIALVPTMGDLHAGHLALVERARRRCRRVVVSIFVNPLQFGAGEDFEAYPRTLERDRERLADLGVDAVFAPEVAALYPRGLEQAVRVTVPGLEDILCGAERPGHFAGVATVVARLFNSVEPDLAVFGEKDYQQLLIIRRLVDDLAFGIEVSAVPTVREADGLALSSRNRYLTAEQRERAPELHAALCAAAEAIADGERDFTGVCERARRRLAAAGFEPGYFEVRRTGDLAPATATDVAHDLRVLAAARLGAARLIDNVAVGSVAEGE